MSLLKFTMIFLLSACIVHAAGDTNVVVMLGDSTTLCSRNKPGAKLTDYVQTYLTQNHLQAIIVNSGRGSDTAKGGFGRLQSAVLAHDPDLVTISFGLNDTTKFTPDEYGEWMEKIVQSIQTNSSAKIMLITSTPGNNNERRPGNAKFCVKGSRRDDYMDANICAAERSLAKKYNLPLCDLHDHFIAQFEKNPKLIDELILPDGVHLTDKGNEVAAQYVAPAIAVLLTEADNDKTK